MGEVSHHPNSLNFRSLTGGACCSGHCDAPWWWNPAGGIESLEDMTKPHKQLLQTHLPKSPDMDSCPLRVQAIAQPMEQMLMLLRELVMTVRKPMQF